MGRGKLKLQFIAHAKTRQTTFHRRKKGMLKKANEFSILCGVDVCLFISGPKMDDNNYCPTELETWPSERSKVMNIIEKYQSAILRKPPKKVHSPTDTFIERKKIKAEISQCPNKSYEAMHPMCLDFIEHFSLDQMSELVYTLDSKIRDINLIIEMKEESELIHKNKCQGPLICGNNDNNQLQVLLDHMPQPGYLSCSMNISRPTSTALSSGDMQDGTTTADLRGMVLRISGLDMSVPPVVDDPMCEIQRMEQYMGCPNYLQDYCASSSSTDGMLLDLDLNMDCMMNTLVQGHCYPLLQAQPPIMPYISDVVSHECNGFGSQDYWYND